MRRLAVTILTGVVALCGALGAAPREDDPAASALLTKLAAADADVRSYRADVAFDVGLHTFPYVRRTLHGNAYFKRPARMELVFSDLPAVARSFSNLYVGLGTPAEWAHRFDITSATERRGERDVRYLVLTPRVPSRRLRQIDVYVDDRAALPDRIVWRYRDGRIEMRQRFASVDGHALVVAQDADIRLPAVHAYVKSTISNYALNVDVDDAVFTKRPEASRP